MESESWQLYRQFASWEDSSTLENLLNRRRIRFRIDYQRPSDQLLFGRTPEGRARIGVLVADFLTVQQLEADLTPEQQAQDEENAFLLMLADEDLKDVATQTEEPDTALAAQTILRERARYAPQVFPAEVVVPEPAAGSGRARPRAASDGRSAGSALAAVEIRHAGFAAPAVFAELLFMSRWRYLTR
jgi:hypothetical protein